IAATRPPCADELRGMPALNDRKLVQLAARAGLIVAWTDAFGTPQHVAPQTLRALLDALRIDDAEALGESFLPALVPVDAARPVLHSMPKALRQVRRARIELELGGARECAIAFDAKQQTLTLDVRLPPGYHTLALGGTQLTLAAAPERCFGVAEATGDATARRWGVAAQVYALRGRH